MTALRTGLVATFLGLAALPALADCIAFDLPRLDFPTAGQARQSTVIPVALVHPRQ